MVHDQNLYSLKVVLAVKAKTWLNAHQLVIRTNLGKGITREVIRYSHEADNGIASIVSSKNRLR